MDIPVRHKCDTTGDGLATVDATKCEFCRSGRSRRSSPRLAGKNARPAFPRIIHAGRNKVAQSVAGTAQRRFDVAYTVLPVARWPSDRGSGGGCGCWLRPPRSRMTRVSFLERWRLRARGRRSFRTWAGGRNQRSVAPGFAGFIGRSRRDRDVRTLRVSVQPAAWLRP